MPDVLNDGPPRRDLQTIGRARCVRNVGRAYGIAEAAPVSFRGITQTPVANTETNALHRCHPCRGRAVIRSSFRPQGDARESLETKERGEFEVAIFVSAPFYTRTDFKFNLQQTCVT